MSAPFPIVLVEIHKAYERLEFFKAAWRSKRKNWFNLFGPRFGSVWSEKMAEPICLTEGPFTLEGVNGEAVLFKASED
jgi:hypothetical protein